MASEGRRPFTHILLVFMGNVGTGEISLPMEKVDGARRLVPQAVYIHGVMLTDGRACSNWEHITPDGPRGILFNKR